MWLVQFKSIIDHLPPVYWFLFNLLSYTFSRTLDGIPSCCKPTALTHKYNFNLNFIKIKAYCLPLKKASEYSKTSYLFNLNNLRTKTSELIQILEYNYPQTGLHCLINHPTVYK
jgi:hypothetical protein